MKKDEIDFALRTYERVLNDVPIKKDAIEVINKLKEKGCQNIYVVNISSNNIDKLNKHILNTFDSHEDVTLIDYENKPSVWDFSEEQSLINYKNGYKQTMKTLSKKL